MTTNNPRLTAALDYAARGWPVLPLAVGQKAPDGRLVPHGKADASLEEKQIRAWWRRSPSAGVGLRLDRLAVLDLEHKPDLGFDAGELRAEMERSLDVPPTRTARTGAGGLHLLYALPEGAEGLRSRIRWRGRAVDLLTGAGAYVVAAPSLHPATGRAYEWLLAEEEEDADGCAPVAPAPDWLLEELRRVEELDGVAVVCTPLDEAGLARWRGHADRALARARAAVQGAEPGARHCALRDNSWYLGKLCGVGLLSAARCEEQLWAEVERAGWDTRSWPGRDTLRSGLVKGALAGWRPPREAGPSPEPEPAHDPETGEVLEAPPPAPQPKPKKVIRIDPETSRWFTLDSGGYAYWAGGRWRECSSQSALEGRIRDSGVHPSETRAYVRALPPAAGFAFDPTHTAPLSWREGVLWLNRYRGLPREAAGGDFSLLWRLIRWTACDNIEAAEYLMDWLALPLQALYAGRGAYRTGICPVLYGAHGSGKGWFGEMLHAIYGDHYLEVGQADLEDGFTPKGLESALIVVANEVANDRDHESRKTLNMLKRWVTDDRISLRRMRRESEPTKPHFNLLMMTNATQPLVLEEGDRRYSFIRHRKKMPADFVDELLAEKAAGWPSVPALIQLLLHRAVQPGRLMPTLENEARAQQTALSQTSEAAFAAEIAEMGMEGLSQAWATACQRRGGEAPRQWYSGEGAARAVLATAVYGIYETFCAERGYRGKVKAVQLQQVLAERIEGVTIKTARVHGTPSRCVVGLPWAIADGEENEL